MSLHWTLAWAGALLTVAAAACALLTALARLAWSMRSSPRPDRTATLPVTLLKPLCGQEADLYASLRSFCQQDYAHYQVVFGAREAADPAIAVARRVIGEPSSATAELIVDDTNHGSNRKVSNLINMLPHARHDVIVIADSDARVDADYLRAVTRPLADPAVGLVTVVYRSVPGPGLWSVLGSMYVNDWYMPAVLLARWLGQQTYASGQTLALRRDTLAAVGGLRGIASHLADDYALAERVRALGLKVVLADCVPSTVQNEPTARDLLTHELRWMRTLRALAPAGYRFLFVTFVFPCVILGTALASVEPQIASRVLWLAGLAVACRIALCCFEPAGRGALALARVALIPLRDVLLCWTWSRALFTSRVQWRGYEYEIDERGVMRSIV